MDFGTCEEGSSNQSPMNTEAGLYYDNSKGL